MHNCNCVEKDTKKVAVYGGINTQGRAATNKKTSERRTLATLLRSSSSSAAVYNIIILSPSTTTTMPNEETTLIKRPSIVKIQQEEQIEVPGEFVHCCA